MGDFNDEPHNRSMRQYALSTHSMMKAKKSKLSPRLYNLTWPLMGKGLGTHYFDNFPNMLDQFLVSKGCMISNSPIRAILDSVKIESFPEMMTDGYKIPKRFERPSSNNLDISGYSDHFPISMAIKES